MKERAKLFLTKAVRAALVLALVAFSVTLARYFYTHKKPLPRVASLPAGDIPDRKVERQEGVKHFEFKMDRLGIEVKADNHDVLPDGRYCLEGRVEIRSFGRKGGQDVRIFGDKVVYDKEMNHFVLSGRGRMIYREASIESEVLDYEKSAETVKSDRGASFSSGSIRGTSQHMTYSLASEELRLEGDVDLRMARTDKLEEMKAGGQRFLYSRKEKKGFLEGGVRFAGGRNNGLSEVMEFVLSEDEKYLHALLLKGGARVHLAEEEGERPSPTENHPFIRRGAKWDIEAGEISLRAFLNLPKIHAVEARGQCVFKLSSSRGTTLVDSEYMKFVFDRWGGLREFIAQDRATMEERAADDSPRRALAGRIISLDAKKNRLAVARDKESAARLEAEDIAVQAGDIALDLGTENLEASGGVRVILKPGARRSDPGVFFSSLKPAFITAEKMGYSREEKRFFFMDKAKVWQEKEMLASREITLYTESREMDGRGEVVSVFPFRLKKEGAEEESVEIGADRIRYLPQENKILYESNCFLKSRGFSLKAGSMTVAFQESGKELKNVVAREKVVIVRDSWEGRGEEARYDLGEDTVVLTGDPVLVDKNRGIVEGDKLTFYLADGRIRVENRTRERSATVIKSEK